MAFRSSGNPAAVRNGILCRARIVASGAQVISVVPANTTWLIKAVQVTSGSSTAATVLVQVADPILGVVQLLPAFELAGIEGQLLETWFCAQPGDQIICSGPTEGYHVSISGAALPGTI